MSNHFPSYINEKLQRNRANELIDEFLTRYNLAKHASKDSKDGKTINAVCFLGGIQFDVYRLRAIPPDLIDVTAKCGDNWIALIAPVEQFSFGIIESGVQSETPPREIGFGNVPAAKDVPVFGQKSGVTL